MAVVTRRQTESWDACRSCGRSPGRLKYKEAPNGALLGEGDFCKASCVLEPSCSDL